METLTHTHSLDLISVRPMADETTREGMISAAIAMLAGGGESSIRVTQVAEAVGVSEPAVYHHFKNRQELVLATYAEWYRRELMTVETPERIVTNSSNVDEFLEGVRADLRWRFNAERNRSRAARLTVLGAAQRDQELTALINAINREFLLEVENLFALARDKGWIRRDADVRAIAYWLIGMVTGRALAEMDDGRVDMDAWDAIAIDAFVGYISAK